MWCQIYSFVVLLSISKCQDNIGSHTETITSVGVNSWNSESDEDRSITNEVITDKEKSRDLKSKVNLRVELKPLDSKDLKCLMSVNRRYCSMEMEQMKSVLIQALQEDCVRCSVDQKEKAGKVMASMMAHDPVLWKLFLTRYMAVEKA